MIISKKQTKMLQGIAILCMLGLHLFNRSNISNYYDVSLYINIFGQSTPLLTIVSYSFDACVPIYLFCSGYGLFKNYMKDKKNYSYKNFKRILNLLYRFWIIMIITCIVGFFMGIKEVYPGSIINFICNVLLLKNSYVGSFWFIQTYVLLVLISKYIFNMLERYNYWKIIFVSFFLYIIAFFLEWRVLTIPMLEPLNLFINAIMLLLRSQFSFIVGGLFSYTNIFDKKLMTIVNNNIFAFLLFMCVVLIRGIILRSMIFAPFSAILFIILFCCNNNKFMIIEKILLYFGKHSTNMWLTHMQYYMIFASSIVFMSRNVFIIFGTLIILSLVSSYFVEYILHFFNRLYKSIKII